MLPKKRPLNKNQSSKLRSFSRPEARDCKFPYKYTETVRSLLPSLITVFGRHMWYYRRTKAYVYTSAAKQSYSWQQVTCLQTVIKAAVQSQWPKIK